MAVAKYRGFDMQTADKTTDVWQVKIKEHLLQGSMAAVKKSIDWFCDTRKIIDPREFSSIASQRPKTAPGTSEDFHGFSLKNDTGEANDWYCMFNGKLIKGGKLAIQKHIEAYLIARKNAMQKK